MPQMIAPRVKKVSAVRRTGRRPKASLSVTQMSMRIVHARR
jgi:hypothetical protein